MNKIKVMLNGYNGKMGQIVAQVIKEQNDMILICGRDKEAKMIDTCKVYSDLNNLPEHPDVIIDFSVPVSTLDVLEFASKNKIPMIIATTGFSKEEETKILDFSKNIPIFKSSNMSLGINIFQKVLKEVVPKLNNTDIEILETHHNRKVDSPSGTALMLANTINSALGGEYKIETNRNKKREKKEIGIASVRGGNVVGEHTVMFLGESEAFEIKHTAYSRKVFAEGAIKAARYIIKKDKGLYDMDDLVKELI